MAPAHSWALALAVVGFVVAIDQLSKQLVISHVERGEPVDGAFGIQITNARNKGVAFGLLGDGGSLVLVLTIATLVLVAVYFALHANRRGLWLAVGLIVGGALGNLADRARIGAAIDFLDPPRWPAFNLADVAIVTGVGLLAWLVTAHDDDGPRAT